MPNNTPSGIEKFAQNIIIILEEINQVYQFQSYSYKIFFFFNLQLNLKHFLDK